MTINENIHFLPSLGTGGAETLVKDYALHFPKNHDLEILVFSPQSPLSVLEKKLQEEGVTIHYLEKDTSKNKLLMFIRRIFLLRSFLKKNESTIEVLHFHLELSKYLVFSKKYLKKCKLVHTVHNEVNVVFNSGIKTKVDMKLISFFFKKYNLQLIALHKRMKQELDTLFNVNNTIALNNGIALERFQRNLYTDKNYIYKNELHIDKDDFVIGHIGRFEEQKNHTFLINIFVEVLKSKSNTKLLLVGSGSLKEQIIKRVDHLHLSDKVIILENRSDIPELLSIMDVFVFPSIYEGLPVTLVETQAMGVKCVVASSVPKEAHLTENYITLYLEQSHEEWCNAIVDDTLRTTPVDSLENYDMREVVKQLEKLYLGHY